MNRSLDLFDLYGPWTQSLCSYIRCIRGRLNPVITIVVSDSHSISSAEFFRFMIIWELAADVFDPHDSSLCWSHRRSCLATSDVSVNNSPVRSVAMWSLRFLKCENPVSVLWWEKYVSSNVSLAVLRWVSIWFIFVSSQPPSRSQSETNLNRAIEGKVARSWEYQYLATVPKVPSHFVQHSVQGI